MRTSTRRSNWCGGAFIIALWATVLSSPAHSQQIVGEIFGKLIGPAVQPVLERAAGEFVLEGLRRGAKDGRIIPRPIPRPTPRPNPLPSPQPIPQPYPQPTPQPYPQPTPQPYPQPTPQPYPQPTPQPYPVSPQPSPQPGQIYYPPVQVSKEYPSQGTPVPSNIISSKPAPARPAAVQPPENQIIVRANAPANASPLDAALRYVISDGPQLAHQVVLVEAQSIASGIDQAIIEFLIAQPDFQALAGEYQSIVASTEKSKTRIDLIAPYDSVISGHAAANAVRNAFQLADSADQLAILPSGVSHQDMVASIETLRTHLAMPAGQIIGGDRLAVTAERVKNLRNLAVTSEISRVLGVQRRSDLFQQLNQATQKSRLPAVVTAALVGVPIGKTNQGVAAMDLPKGNPSVVLYNPLNNPAPINFICDDTLKVTLGPGELVPLNQKFVLAFQNGTGALKRYTITKGLFRWALDEKGWDVREKKSIRFTIDATQSPVAFRYLFNGEPQELAAGASVEHYSPIPPRLDFETGVRSSGGEKQTKSTLITPGKYSVAVDLERGSWDLFEQGPLVKTGETSASIASELLRESVRMAVNAGADPVQSQVDSLLNAIE